MQPTKRPLLTTYGPSTAAATSSAQSRQCSPLRPSNRIIQPRNVLVSLSVLFREESTMTPFTTCYHTRFPEYLAARRVAPSRFVYAMLRRFHNAGSGMMVSTETLGRELD